MPTYLIIVSTQANPEKQLQSDLRKEDCSTFHSYQRMLSSVETSQESHETLFAKNLAGHNMGTCWVRLVTIHEKDIATYRTSRVGKLEISQFYHQTYSVQTDPAANSEQKVQFSETGQK